VVSGLVGAYACQLLATAVHWGGLVRQEGSANPLEQLAILFVCGAFGASSAWLVLRYMNREEWLGPAGKEPANDALEQTKRVD
jgi:hypothetical protein